MMEPEPNEEDSLWVAHRATAKKLANGLVLRSDELLRYVFLTPCDDGCDWKGVAYGPDFADQLKGHKPGLPTEEEVALAVLSNRVLYRGPRGANATVATFKGLSSLHNWMETERGGTPDGRST